jgi:hypothetical protein
VEKREFVIRDTPGRPLILEQHPTLLRDLEAIAEGEGAASSRRRTIHNVITVKQVKQKLREDSGFSLKEKLKNFTSVSI